MTFSEPTIACAEFLVRLVLNDEEQNGGMLSRPTLVQARKVAHELQIERRRLQIAQAQESQKEKPET
jgi:hypothetical protein